MPIRRIVSNLRFLMPIAAACLFSLQAAANEPARRVLSLRATIPMGETLHRSVAWSPDGRSIAVGGVDGTVRVYSSRTGLRTAESGLPAGELAVEVDALAFHPDGARIAGAIGRRVYLWKAEGGRSSQLFDAEGPVHWLDFADDGAALFAAGSWGVLRWDVVAGRARIRTHSSPLSYNGASVSADGGRIAVHSRPRELSVLDGRDLTPLATCSRPDATYLGCFALSPDGGRLVAVGQAQEGRRRWGWETDGGTLVVEDATEDPTPLRMKFSPGGESLLGLNFDSGLRLHDPHDGVVLCRVGPRSLGIVRSFRDAAFAPDGRALALVRGGPRPLEIYDLADDLSRRRVSAAWTGAIRADQGGRTGVYDYPDKLIPVPGGERVLVRTALRFRGRREDPVCHELELLDLFSGRALRRFDQEGLQGQRLLGVAALPNGREMVVGLKHRGLVVYDLATGLPTGEPRVAIADLDWDAHVSVSADGSRWAYVGFDRRSGASSVNIFDAAAGAVVRTLPLGVVRPPTALALSLDGGTVAAGDFQGNVFLWNSTDGAQVSPTKTHVGAVTTLAFSRDGRRLASSARGEGEGVAVWDVGQGRLERCIKTDKTAFAGAAFSRDGRRLAAAGNDRRIHLFDLDDGAPRGRFASRAGTYDRGGFAAVAAAPDGDGFIAVGHDAGIASWRFADLENVPDPNPDLVRDPVAEPKR